jgi:uncharacterized protein
VSRYTVSVIRILLFALLFLPAAGQEYAMRWYVLGILEKGPTWSPEVTEQSKKLQEGHIANMARLGREGKLIVAGPLADAGDFRGIFLFDTEKVEEARQWSDSDPAVQAGRLKVRLMRWYAAKGIKPDPPVSK